jgi:hypothetical protein
MKRPSLASLFLLAFLLAPRSGSAFCGFYVASGDAKLYNRASQVALVRDGDRTVMTLANDFKGEPKEFAIVVPVPTVLEKGQIHVADRALVEHLDSFTAPRLVEYFDEDPCGVPVANMMVQVPTSKAMHFRGGRLDEKSLGVTIEAQYSVGEYDILILSAQQSSGLETWLTTNGYRVPAGASRVLGIYLKQGMKFFVAKVNLKEQQKLGFTYLRPLQIAYESPKFMLPIRLGMVNADGVQELFVYAITKQGRVEATNYRNVKIPTNVEIPEYVKDDFKRFYTAMFDQQVRLNDMSVVYTEHAWDMTWCDPCAAAPLSQDELRNLGVFWANDPASSRGGATPVFVTRLHARYDRAHFPEDLVFQVTGDKTNFQGRYIIRHEWKGDAACDASKTYRLQLRDRRRLQAEGLAGLTGWKLDDIRGRMAASGDWSMANDDIKWWERLWKQ